MTAAIDWLNAEPVIRGGFFLGAVLSFGAAERLWPRRGDGRWKPRQLINVALVVLDTLMLRLLFPVLGIGIALAAQQQQFGLLNRLTLPQVVAVAAALLALDCAIYLQHRLFHLVPWLWRAHRVHHSDTAFDLSLGLRFHPIEIALSMLVKLGLIAALGAPPLAVLIFEIVLFVGSAFSHSDLALPIGLDRALRCLIVTPDMHRVHHSVHRDETDSNFGFNFSFWDRLFGTYRAQPRDGHTAMAIGLTQFRAAGDQRLLALLAQPFKKGDGGN